MHKTMHKSRTNAQEKLAQKPSLFREALCERTKGQLCAADVRAVIEKTNPELLAFMDAARDRLGARLKYLDTDTVKAGREPDWLKG